MFQRIRKKPIVMILLGSILVGSMSGFSKENHPRALAASDTATPMAMETATATSTASAIPTATATSTASAIPTATAIATTTVSATPTATATATVSATPSATAPATVTSTPQGKYRLLNAGANYKKGGQKGIGYGKVKKEKIYHIYSYASDSVKLRMNQPSRFTLVGAKNKSGLKKFRVNQKGEVKVKFPKKRITYSVVVKATSKTNGKTAYIYISYRPLLQVITGDEVMKIMEGTKGHLTFNYSRKKLKITYSKKRIHINSRGIITPKKLGKCMVTVKVKGSQKNQLKIRIFITEKPWIVNRKDTLYTYNDMLQDMSDLHHKYGSRCRYFSIGSSEDNRKIMCMVLGNTNAKRTIVFNGGIHAREYINPQMLMRQTEDILRNYGEFQEILKKTCVYVLPMLNPDGITIAQSGFQAIRDPKLRKICKKTKSSARTWKANARGVNLNNNFPANFTKSKKKKPDGSSYYGKQAASEKETQAIVSFIQGLHHVKLVLNYHSTGSILYWDYSVEKYPDLYAKQKEFATTIHNLCGYGMIRKGISTKERGGMGDWLVYEKKIPSVTIETGVGACPLSHSQLMPITKKQRKVIWWALKSA